MHGKAIAEGPARGRVFGGVGGIAHLRDIGFHAGDVAVDGGGHRFRRQDAGADGDEQELGAVDIRRRRARQHRDQFLPAGGRQAIEPGRGAAGLGFQPRGDEPVLLQPGKGRVDGPEARIDELAEGALDGELADVVAARLAELQHGEAHSAHIHGRACPLSPRAPRRPYIEPVYAGSI